MDEKLDYNKLVNANIKLLDENKLIKSDIKTLIDYIQGNIEKKEDLEEQVQNIFKIYKKAKED